MCHTHRLHHCYVMQKLNIVRTFDNNEELATLTKLDKQWITICVVFGAVVMLFGHCCAWHTRNIRMQLYLEFGNTMGIPLWTLEPAVKKPQDSAFCEKF